MISVSKSFSLIELIFAIIILAIIASIALPKLFDTTSKTSLIKIKTDLLLIQNALNEYKNKSILKGENISLDKLDNGKFLFINILPNKTFVNEKSSNSWEKLSDTEYYFWFNKNENLLFTYNSSVLSFTCNKSDEKCQEVLK